ncbi:unnamed protein product, partial [Protopolystoma xenopodis]
MLHTNLRLANSGSSSADFQPYAQSALSAQIAKLDSDDSDENLDILSGGQNDEVGSDLSGPETSELKKVVRDEKLNMPRLPLADDALP